MFQKVPLFSWNHFFKHDMMTIWCRFLVCFGLWIFFIIKFLKLQITKIPLIFFSFTVYLLSLLFLFNNITTNNQRKSENNIRNHIFLEKKTVKNIFKKNNIPLRFGSLNRYWRNPSTVIGIWSCPSVHYYMLQRIIARSITFVVCVCVYRCHRYLFSSSR